MAQQAGRHCTVVTQQYCSKTKTGLCHRRLTGEEDCAARPAVQYLISSKEKRGKSQRMLFGPLRTSKMTKMMSVLKIAMLTNRLVRIVGLGLIFGSPLSQ